MDVKRFEFNNSFDMASGVADDPNAIYEKAFNDAKREIEAELLKEISDLSLKVEKLLTRQDEIIGNLANDTARLTYAIITKIFENYAKNNGHIDEICALIKETIISSDDQAKLIINISPNIADQIEGTLSSQLSPHMMNQVSFVSDDNFDEASCRIDWFEGGIERSLKGILSNIQGVFEKISKNQGLNIKDIGCEINGKEEINKEQKEQ